MRRLQDQAKQNKVPEELIHTESDWTERGVDPGGARQVSESPNRRTPGPRRAILLEVPAWAVGGGEASSWMALCNRDPGNTCPTASAGCGLSGVHPQKPFGAVPGTFGGQSTLATVLGAEVPDPGLWSSPPLPPGWPCAPPQTMISGHGAETMVLGHLYFWAQSGQPVRIWSSWGLFGLVGNLSSAHSYHVG